MMSSSCASSSSSPSPSCRESSKESSAGGSLFNDLGPRCCSRLLDLYAWGKVYCSYDKDNERALYISSHLLYCIYAQHTALHLSVCNVFGHTSCPQHVARLGIPAAHTVIRWIPIAEALSLSPTARSLSALNAKRTQQHRPSQHSKTLVMHLLPGRYSATALRCCSVNVRTHNAHHQYTRIIARSSSLGRLQRATNGILVHVLLHASFL